MKRAGAWLRLPMLTAATLLLCSCASVIPKTDLYRLYATQAGNPNQPPVVLIHGALGSRLYDPETGEEHWPGNLGDLAFSDYRSLRLEIDPDRLVPRPSNLHIQGVTSSIGGVDFYGRIMTTLEEFGGYQATRPGTRAARGDQRYYVFLYDWRQDNVTTVRQLDAFIERIREDHADPELRVDIIAHSMGGMITRYYARYGTVDVLDDNDFPINQDGAKKIRRVILLGTPNLGSTGALETLIRGFKIGLGTVPPEVTATFPSTYQVLPHAITNWFVTMEGQPLKRDQFSADTFWKRFGYSVYDDEVQARIRARFDSEAEADDYIELLQRYFEKHIERARRFSWSLTVPIENPQLRYVIFGGDCLPTPARLVEEPTSYGSALRLSPSEIANPLPGIDYDRLMLEPGDGRVTKASLLAKQTVDPTVARHEYSFFHVDYPVFLCERHTRLTGNIDFQNNLLHALLSIDR